jgi:hypothetical protein
VYVGTKPIAFSVVKNMAKFTVGCGEIPNEKERQ